MKDKIKNNKGFISGQAGLLGAG